jgi:hypothetical protein
METPESSYSITSDPIQTLDIRHDDDPIVGDVPPLVSLKPEEFRQIVRSLDPSSHRRKVDRKRKKYERRKRRQRIEKEREERFEKKSYDVSPDPESDHRDTHRVYQCDTCGRTVPLPDEDVRVDEYEESEGEFVLEDDDPDAEETEALNAAHPAVTYHVISHVCKSRDTKIMYLFDWRGLGDWFFLPAGISYAIGSYVCLFAQTCSRCCIYFQLVGAIGYTIDALLYFPGLAQDEEEASLREILNPSMSINS